MCTASAPLTALGCLAGAGRGTRLFQEKGKGGREAKLQVGAEQETGKLEGFMQAGRLDQSQAASREDQEAWTRLQDRAHGPGRMAGAGCRLQAERSELIWQHEGPSCRQRRQEAGELAWRQGSLEMWRVGGREAQPQAGRSGLG